MFVEDKFAGPLPVHPIARHQGIKQTCEQIGAVLPKAFPIRVWNNFKTSLRNWQQRRIDRQAFQHMVTLDDPLLRDIGVTKSDVIWASKLPLSINAALELEKIARQNKRTL